MSGGLDLPYQYDAFGRVVSHTTGFSSSTSYTYDGFDRMVSESTHSGITANATKTFTYDPLDRPILESVTGGGILNQTTKKTRYDYVGLGKQIAAEEQPSTGTNWQVVKSYSYNPAGRTVALTNRPVGGSASTQYYTLNPHTDTEALTNPDGTTKANYRYTAYGDEDDTGTTGSERLNPFDSGGGGDTSANDVLNPFRFNDKHLEVLGGTYDMGFRNYSSSIGSFLSRDMYNGALDDMRLGMDPWGVNRYAFAGGNPVTGVELDGHIHMPGDPPDLAENAVNPYTPPATKNTGYDPNARASWPPVQWPPAPGQCSCPGGFSAPSGGFTSGEGSSGGPFAGQWSDFKTAAGGARKFVLGTALGIGTGATNVSPGVKSMMAQQSAQDTNQGMMDMVPAAIDAVTDAAMLASMVVGGEAIPEEVVLREAALETVTRAGTREVAANAGSKLLPKVDNTFQFPGAGRSGAGVKNFLGPPNAIARGASPGRVFVTDEQGRVIFDVTRDRVKPVMPGQGFVSGDGRKLSPTAEQLGWIDELWGS
jgi:RHS repeat-associated protein